MRCLSCQYDLRHQPPQTENRCPECGRVFDPRNPRTYHTGPPRLKPLAIIGLIIALLSLFWVPLLLNFINSLF